MKSLSKLFLLFLLIVTTQSMTAPSTNGTIIVEVSNIESNRGYIRIGIYQKEKFLKSVYTGKKTPVNGTQSVTITIPDIPYGKYALAIHHDVNSNDKLDKNFWGVPKEPYAFSNGAKAKWREPKFYEANISFRQNKQRFYTQLNYWKDL